MSGGDKSMEILSDIFDVLAEHGVRPPFADFLESADAITAISMMAASIFAGAGARLPPDGVDKLIDTFDAHVRLMAHEGAGRLRRFAEGDANPWPPFEIGGSQ
ncbi:hypothetical protein ACFQU1_04925 [Chelatococcus sp. GCM10030263]|uniref:hypothetical protein n=1 Tax=Chelatococcus sp. GCM10030263 TaxID=3273387 RepID=UPI0036148759